MRRIFNIGNFYTLALFLFSFKEVFSIGHSVIAKILMATIVIFGLYSFIRVNQLREKPKFFTYTNLFFLIMVMYGIINLFVGKVLYFQNGDPLAKIVFLYNILISFLPIYTFYHFTREGYFDERWMRIFVLILIIATTASYFESRERLMLEAMNLDDGMTNNVGYAFLGIMPFMVLFKDKPLLQLTLISYVSLFILGSMKRGAIIISIVCLIYFFYTAFKNSKGNTRLYLTLMLFAFIGVSLYALSHYFNNSYFLMRLEDTLEGNSNGRDLIYTELWNAFKGYDIIEKIFGLGANATLEIAGFLAHQDWLELAIDCGLVGVFSYLLFYISFYKSTMRISNPIVRIQLLMSIIILLTKSLFSMGFSNIGLAQSLCIGYCFAIGAKQKYLKH